MKIPLDRPRGREHRPLMNMDQLADRRIPLAQRCRIHAVKMAGEGWYVTANVLAAAADRLDELETKSKPKKRR